MGIEPGRLLELAEEMAGRAREEDVDHAALAVLAAHAALEAMVNRLGQVEDQTTPVVQQAPPDRDADAMPVHAPAGQGRSPGSVWGARCRGPMRWLCQRGRWR
jgi:hypothetical protein